MNSIKQGLQWRAIRIGACLKVGPPVWERVKPPGYDTLHERCIRCKVLRKQHTLPDNATLETSTRRKSA